jgi:hypothetical protein
MMLNTERKWRTLKRVIQGNKNQKKDQNMISMVAVMIHDVEYKEEVENSAKEIIDKEDMDR